MPLPHPDGVQILLTLGTLAAALITLRKLIVPAWRWCARKAQRTGDLVAVFIGRDGYRDRLTGKEVEKVPSLVDALVQIRTEQGEQGKRIGELTTVVTQVADQQVTLAEHTKQIADLRLGLAVHTEQIGMLKAATDERKAIHEETARLFDMVAKRDSEVIDEQGTP